MSKQPGRPRYRQIADDLRDRIARGDYAPGDQLPTKSELMKQWGVALNTVDRAIEELRKDSVVETFHGVGTFVLEAAPPETSGPDKLEDLQARLEQLETQMEEVYSNLGLPYPASAPTKTSVEEAG